MTNFIFKSQLSDFKKISQQLKTILDNQRHSRNDMAVLQGQVTKIFNALALQKQVDDYFEDHSDSAPPNEDAEPD